MTGTFTLDSECLCLLTLNGVFFLMKHGFSFKLLIVLHICDRLFAFEPDITLGQLMFPESESPADA